LRDEIEDAFDAAEVELIEGSGGVFEVIVDGTLVYSKKETGRHAEPGEVLGLMQQNA
jgi:selenoprotein W-related protein